MKKSIILPVSLFAILNLAPMLSRSVYAHDNAYKNEKTACETLVASNENNVSQDVKSSFHTEFGHQANVQWGKTENFEVASFTLEGQKLNAFFDNDGELVGRAYNKSWNDLPFRAQLKIIENYKDYNVNGVFVFCGNSLIDADNYYVGLTKDDKTVIVKVNEFGKTSLFKRL